MNALTRRWQPIAVVVGLAAGVGWLLPPGLPKSPPPPDFTGKGITSVRVELGHPEYEGTEQSATIEDRAVIAQLAELIRTARPIEVCRCSSFGTLEFRRPDGAAGQVWLVPAHHDGSVEFEALDGDRMGRYRVSRERFLQVVEPVGIPAERWYKFPEPPPRESLTTDKEIN